MQKNLHQTSEGQTLRVMIVDKQDVCRQKIRDMLHGIGGFRVIAETASCQKTLKTIARTPLDLVITELLLEDRNGTELIVSLKQQPVAPHVVIFSAALHASALMSAILAGADGYRRKDMPTRDLIRACKSFERSGPAMPPAVIASVISMLVERCNTIENQRAAHINALKKDCSFVYSLQTQQSKNEGTPALRTSFPAARLSPQEERVFTLLRYEQSNQQIAAGLAISPYTVGKHVHNIVRKLGVVNRTQAAA